MVLTLILATLHPITLLQKLSWRCSLCARWLFFITPDSSFLLLPAPCHLLPCWELTAYLPLCLGGPALPRPLPLSWLNFPQVPGQRLTLMLGTITTDLPLAGNILVLIAKSVWKCCHIPRNKKMKYIIEHFHWKKLSPNPVYLERLEAWDVWDLGLLRLGRFWGLGCC